jgi:hypothetical protein
MDTCGVIADFVGSAGVLATSGTIPAQSLARVVGAMSIMSRSGYVQKKSLEVQASQLLNLPNVIRKPSLHGWRNPQRLMDMAEIVVHEMQRYVVGVILDLL